MPGAPHDPDDPTSRLVELTRDLALIPSTESRPEERARCFQLVRQHLDGIPGLDLRDFESGGFTSMVARPAGVEEPEVLMVAHLDVIEHGDASLYRTELDDGRIVGPGVGDMKGQLAILIELMRSLHRERPGIPVGLAVTSDEERGGEHGIGHLFGDEVRMRCGMAIVPDGGSPTQVTVEEKGILHLRMETRGREIHAARPWLAGNAVLELARALAAVSTRFDGLRGEVAEGDREAGGDHDHWFPTFAPTIVGTGNSTVNCLPASAFAVADIRFPPPFTSAEVEGIVREASGPGVEVEVMVAAEPTRLDPDPLFLQVVREIGDGEVTPVRASGGSDARFIAHQGIPVILSRPEVGNLHGLDEWIGIGSMTQFYQVCREFVLRKLAG